MFTKSVLVKASGMVLAGALVLAMPTAAFASQSHPRSATTGAGGTSGTGGTTPTTIAGTATGNPADPCKGSGATSSACQQKVQAAITAAESKLNAAAAKETDIENKAVALEPRIQAIITKVSNAGISTTSAQATFADFESSVTAAQTATGEVAGVLAGANPSDLAGLRQIAQQARGDLETARTDLRQAQTDMHTLTADLKAVKTAHPGKGKGGSGSGSGSGSTTSTTAPVSTSGDTVTPA